MQRVSQERCAAELEVMILAFVAFERGGGAGHGAYFEVGHLSGSSDGRSGRKCGKILRRCVRRGHGHRRDDRPAARPSAEMLLIGTLHVMSKAQQQAWSPAVICFCHYEQTQADLL